MSNTNPTKQTGSKLTSSSFYKIPAMLLIDIDKCGNSLGSDRGQKTST
jgi:hypothetical protein